MEAAACDGCSPVRLLGLSGRRPCRPGDGGGAAGRLGDRRVGRWAGESGVVWVRLWVVTWGSGLVGDWTGGGGTRGVLEREETLQDLRRGKASVG